MSRALPPYDRNGLRVVRYPNGCRIDVKQGGHIRGVDVVSDWFADDAKLQHVLGKLNEYIKRSRLDAPPVTLEAVRNHVGAIA